MSMSFEVPALVSLAALCILVSACSNGGGRCTGTDDLGHTTCLGGEPCTEDFDCMSRSCGAGVCAPGCDSAADCAAGEACITDGETIMCRATCPPGAGIIGDSGGLVCEGGALVTCDTATNPEGLCDVCGCSAGATCDHLAGDLPCGFIEGDCSCVIPAALGEPCTTHTQCASRNCSGTHESTERHCQVAAGAACTSPDENCAQCNLPVVGSTVPVCRQSCDGDGDCGGAPCLGNRTTHEFGCYTECTDDASECGPGETCDFIEGDFLDRRYCAPR